MKLEHAQLERFEPSLIKLINVAHTSGISELEKKGWRLQDIENDRAALRAFVRGCHYGYDLAQRQIAKQVIDMELTARDLSTQMKEFRRQRDRSRARAALSLIEILRNRQLTLRRLADSVLYAIILADNWLLRRFTRDLKVHDIDPAVLERTVRIATDRNREDRLKFNFVSDLSTVIQIGDLLEIDLAGEGRKWKLIELKQGKVNEKLTALIEEGKLNADGQSSTATAVPLNEKATEQARRMIKQQRKMNEIVRFVTLDRGFEGNNELETFITPDSVVLDNYLNEIVRIYRILLKKGGAAGQINGCLRICGFDIRQTKQTAWHLAQHQFFHMADPSTPCALKETEETPFSDQERQKVAKVPYFVDITDFNLHVPIAEPIFAWADKSLVLDLVTGRVKIFVQFDLEAFRKYASSHKIKTEWLRGIRANAEIRSMSMRIPGMNDVWGLNVELPSGHSQVLLSGFLSRPYTNFVTPHQMIQMILDLPAQIGKMKFSKPSDNSRST